MSNNQSQAQLNSDLFQYLMANPMSAPAPAGSSSAPQSSNQASQGFAGFQNQPTSPFLQPLYQTPQGFSPLAPPGYSPLSPPVYPNLQQLGNYHQQFQQQFQQLHQQAFSPGVEVQDSVDTGDDAAVEVSARAKGKGKKAPKKLSWTDEEEKLLAERWTDATENPIVGRSQTDDSFWNTIMGAFNKLVDPSRRRNKNQLTSKWKNIRTDVTTFGACLKKFGKQSGADDKHVYDAAHDLFRQQQGGGFKYEKCYHVLKDFPKFWTDYGLTKHTQLQDEPFIDLNLDDSTPEPTPDVVPNTDPGMNALFCDDPISRPAGRNTSRKSQRTGSSSDATSSRASAEETLAGFQAVARAQTKLAETIEQTTKEAARKQEVFQAFTYLSVPLPAGLSEFERKKLEDVRAKMWQKYGSEFDNIGNDE